MSYPKNRAKRLTRDERGDVNVDESMPNAIDVQEDEPDTDPGEGCIPDGDPRDRDKWRQ